MTARVRQRLLTDPVYNAEARVLVGSAAATQAWLTKHCADHEALDPDVLASTVEYTTDQGTEWFVCLPPAPARTLTIPQVGTVVHESFHLCVRILRNRGVVLTEDSEEAYAYYLGALFQQLAQAVQAGTRPRRRRRSRRRSRR